MIRYLLTITRDEFDTSKEVILRQDAGTSEPEALSEAMAHIEELTRQGFIIYRFPGVPYWKASRTYSNSEPPIRLHIALEEVTDGYIN